jgi:ABC-type uncharacterized transport system substrate-binding protein
MTAFWIFDFRFWIGRSERNKTFRFALSTMLFALCVFAQAQQPTKIFRVGAMLGTFPSTSSGRIEAFRQGLRALGYVEGKDIVIEYRWAEGKVDPLPGFADDLVRLNVDVILTGTTAATRAAKKATSTIPIVMAQDTDPVGNGLVASLAHPGGNVTGLATLAPEMSGKRLELLKEIGPKISRVAVLGTSTNVPNAQMLRESEHAARALGVKLQYLDVLSPKDIETAFRAAGKEKAKGLLVLNSGLFNSYRTQIIEHALKSRLPAMYYAPEWVEDGGLTSYSPNIPELWRRAATYVDKILKGAKPGDLPVEQPTRFEFVINLKTAKQIGVTIPPNVLARADKVIR